MSSETRNKMIVGAADLIRRRGANATSLREVVRYTDTPRGSITHHFPQGKQQLVEEALRFAGLEVSEPLERLVSRRGTIAWLRAFVEQWRHVLKSTGFEAGCPVLAIAIEQYIGEDGSLDEKVQTLLLAQTNEIFETWQGILRCSLRKEGVAPRRAQRLAALTVSAVEGTVALCRAARSVRALDDVQTELEALLASAIPAT